MKDIVRRMNQEVATWKKMFANHLLDKRLISRIYKELSKLNNKKYNPRGKKMSKGYEWALHQRRCTNGKSAC